MIRSMTGFGLGSSETGRFAVRAEVRSVNNRNLRVTLRLPERLQALEPEFEKMLREAMSRGTVTAAITLDDVSGDPGYVLDTAAIEFYRDALKKIEKGKVPLAVLIALPGAVRKKPAEEIPDELATGARQAMQSAVKQLVAAREGEGAFIWKDMTARCRAIGALVERVEARIPRMIEEYRRRLSDRLAKLLDGIGTAITPEDVRKEVALFADRSDVSEEITRLRRHLALMARADAQDEPSGRKLEFVMQEMFREANTMGSKATDAEMVQDMLDIKSEIEKLREQALNVE
jgi:uncharacterized protein (TIGR00255 family)